MAELERRLDHTPDVVGVGDVAPHEGHAWQGGSHRRASSLVAAGGQDGLALPDQVFHAGTADAVRATSDDVHQVRRTFQNTGMPVRMPVRSAR